MFTFGPEHFFSPLSAALHAVRCSARRAVRAPSKFIFIRRDGSSGNGTAAAACVCRVQINSFGAPPPRANVYK
jgi:hypothetical protein